MQNFAKGLFCTFKNDRVVPPLILFICYITFIDLHIVNHPGTLIIVHSIFNVLLNLVCKYFIEDFCIYVNKEIVLAGFESL
jgi:hypothetical protein